MKRILALLLTVIMMFGTLAIDIAAGAVSPEYVTDSTGNVTDEIDYELTLEKYLTLEFKTEQEKLESMTMVYENHGYQLWFDDYTGEMATLNLATGQILFSNPYDIGTCGSSAAVKGELYSQVVIKYTDNDTEKTMNSFTEAASRGQVKFEYIKNGVRVEYSIGREETRMLVPRVIERSRFEEAILQPFADEINRISEENGYKILDWRNYLPIAKRSQLIPDSAPDGNAKNGNTEWFKFQKLLAFYSEKFLGEAETEKERQSMRALYPICTKMDIWVCTPDISRNELITVENYIKTYIPSYTFEQLEYDHQLTEYEGQDKAPPLFKMALEYTLDENGMSVRLPANGLRFDESLYKLTYVSILPYMGAGANYLLDQKEETFTGYNFFPDGSGSLFRHEDLAGKATTVINGKVYGQDYAYNTITGSNQQVIRYPVFGIVSNTHRTVQETVEERVTEEAIDADGNVIILDKEGNVVEEHKYEELTKEKLVEESKGFVAIIEEGDALAELSNYHMGSSGKYNTVQMLFYPRPKDSYNLANAISVGANATWTVVSSRKYVGNYKIRYIMLTDEAIAEERQITDYYECSWMGMAEAYRDYLYQTGNLEALTAEDIKDDIPVYIETFGTLETLEKIMSIPVNVMTSLTSFENIKTMYDELSAEGVSNMKFKLTGYANGGMYSAVPYKLEWEKSVGGSNGYEDLLAYSAEKGFEVFPEFNFAYSRQDHLFDGLTLKKHIVKSINDTYMSRRYYSATRQTHVGRFELAISAAYFSHFYDKLTENLLKNYENNSALKAISVASLGTDLNSDFDEDEPYNREDSKKYTQELFAQMTEDYDHVMTEGANAYTWKYVDYIINVPLDSSRYNKSANAVPFIGVVLHGSVQFAGTPLNMEGNIGYSMLKAIENGASLYFVLCYENYEELKEDNRLSEYYSVRYDILKEDVVKYYTIINDLTKDLQLNKIVGHQFLIGERVPDADEVIADEEALKLEAEMAAKLEAEIAAKELQEALLEGRVYAAINSGSAVTSIDQIYRDICGYYNGDVIINDKGIVSVRLGMKTLVDAALAKAEVKNPLDDAYALANAWDKTYKSYTTNFVSSLTGTNKVYYDLLSTYNTKATSLTTAVNAIAEKAAALETTVADSTAAKIAALPILIKAYDGAVAAGQDATAALAAITTFVASIDDARAYAQALDSKNTAEAELAVYIAALNKTLSDAKKAYEAAQGNIHIAGSVTAADYAEKYETLTTAKSTLSRLESILSQLNGALATYGASYPDSAEHKLIISYIADYEPQVAAAKVAVANAYNAVDEYYLAVDSGFKALKDAYEAANAAVENYETSAEYLAFQNTIATSTATIESLASVEASVKAAYEKSVADYLALKNTEMDNAAQMLALENQLLASDAKYAEYAAKVATAKAELAAITEAYTEEAQYKEWVEKLIAPIDAKIAEKTAKIKTASAEDQIKLAADILTLNSVKYQKVKVPTNTAGKDFDILYEVEKNADGFVIGGGYIINDYISKYKKAAEATDAYKTAKTNLTNAESALASYKNSTLATLKTTDAYKALDAAKKEATTAMSKFVFDNNTFKTAVTQYATSLSNEVTARNQADEAKASLDAAKYYTGIDSFTAVYEALNAALANNPNILTAYQAALKDYNTAFGYVKSQVTSINNLFSGLNTQANKANKALKNSIIAMEYYNDPQFAGVYNSEFINSLNAVYNETLANTTYANGIIDLAVAKFIETLELATAVIPNTNTELVLKALRVEVSADNKVTITEYEEEVVEEEIEEETYEYTKYTDDSGSITYTEFDNGTYFIINYNYYAVDVVFDGVTHRIAPYGGVKVIPGAEPIYFTTTK